MSDAERIQLMQSAAEQSNGNRPVIQLSGYTFQRVTVDSVQAADGTTYETLFIAAHRSGEFNVPYQVKAHIVCLVRVVIWQHNVLLSKGCIDMFDGISRVEHITNPPGQTAEIIQYSFVFSLRQYCVAQGDLHSQ